MLTSPPQLAGEQSSPASFPGEPFIVTASGRAVPLLTPEPDDISIHDIAHHLSRLNRFTGATRQPLSVAQHSILISARLDRLGPRHALLGLLHDSHEAYLGNIATPVKRAIGGGENLYEQLAANFDRIIHAAFGLRPPSPDEASAIAESDATVLAIEWRDQMPPQSAMMWPIPSGAEVYGGAAWDYRDVQTNFLSRFHRLARICCAATGAHP